MMYSESDDILRRLFLLVTAALTIVALYVARDIFLPLALAVLLSFLLAPVVSRIERIGLSRIPSVLIVVSLTICLVGSLAWVVGDQFVQISADLPRHKNRLIAKVRAARGTTNEAIGRAKETIEEIGKEITRSTDDDAEVDEPGRTKDLAWYERLPGLRDINNKQAMEVKVVELPPSPLQQVQTWLGPLVAPLTTAGIVMLFTIFMLIQREDLRNRFLYLIGTHQLHGSTLAINDGARRLSRYLQMQLMINVCYGTAVGLGLNAIGVPNALLWGVLGVLLRFLPYVGPWIVAVVPISLALAVFDGWTGPLLTIGLFVTLELIVNNVLEPWLYGTSTGVSAVGIVLSVVFWTWLWGPVGLVMAMPLTVCLVVMGKHVPQLAFLHTLLSDEAALSRHERLYQRLLAKDEVETDKLVMEYAADHDRITVFDDLMIPALQLAEKDRHADHLDDVHVQFIAQVYERLLTDLGEGQASVDSRPSEAERLRILCLPAKDEADRLVAKMFSQVASPLGFDTDIASGDRLLGESMESLAKTPCDLVMISALPPAAGKLSRYYCKRIHAHFPTLTILVGLWGGDRLTTTKTKLLQAGASHSVSSMAASVDFLQRKRSALSLARELRDVPSP